MSKKTILIELRQMIYQHLQAFVSNLSEAERAVEGQLDNWAIKNILIHVALWDERMGHSLQAIARGQPPKIYDNYQEINNQDFETHRQDTWEQVLALIESAQQALLEGLQALDEPHFLRNDALLGNQERPTWFRISGTCITHPMLHMCEYYVSHDQAQRALEMVIDLSARLSYLDESDQWQGMVIYNQACYYALAGHKARAIQMVRQALSLDAGLVEWSKQDPDLESLRQELEFQALYASEPAV